MRGIETIVFDLGGVLIDWNPRYVFDQIFDTEEKTTYFLENVCNGKWNAQQDKGRSFEEGITLLQEKYPEFHDIIPLYFSRWPEMIGGEISGSVEILRSLYNQKRCRLYALTNWSAETFPYAWKNFPFLRLFEGILVSGKEKLIKPDAKIYQLLLRRFDIEPSTSIFIDDSEKNVLAARKEGMEAIVFQNADLLKNQLAELDVLL